MLMSTGTNRGAPARAASTSSSTRVFSQVPAPSSTTVPAAPTMSAARARRISASARVG